MPESKSTTDFILKGLIAAMLALCSVIGGMVGWYVKGLRDEVVELRKELRTVSRVQAIGLGENPYEDPE